MTRGNLCVITDKGIFASVQFNGDMYLEDPGHGKEVLERLARIKNILDFEQEVIAFDKKNFGYSEEDGYCWLTTQWENLDFTDNYFTHYNSDYIYIKNISGQPYSIQTRDGSVVTMQPQQICIFYFGELLPNEQIQEEETETGQEPPKLTNADVIRSMTNEELACFLRQTAETHGRNLFHCFEWTGSSECKARKCEECAVFDAWLAMPDCISNKSPADCD